MNNYVEAALPLPMQLEGVTAQWVSQALSIRYPGTEVAAVVIDGVIAGTASKARLNIEFSVNPDDLPVSMYIKGGFHGAEQLELVGGGYLREASFYRDFGPVIEDLEFPQCYFAGANSESGQGIVLLEDLTARKVTFGRATQPIGADVAAATLEWLAKLHGRFWNIPKDEKLLPWPGLIKVISKTFFSEGYWDEMIGRPLAAPLPDAMRDPDRVLQALEIYWDIFISNDKFTFVHGDTHLGNMYFLPDGSPGFLDWQSPMRGPWSDDMSYFLVGSLSVEDRRRHERELIRHYLDCLKGTGVDVPSFDETWLQYRQHVMHGFMWVSTPPQMQPDDVVAANTERYCAAFEDLETLDALGL